MAKYIDAERGLSWVRLDCSFPRNPKVLVLVEAKAWRAIAVYIAGLSYSGEHGLDGYLPRSCLVYLHGTQRDAQQLEEVGLWHWAEGGWDINDWHDYQPSALAAQERSNKARAAAEIRWKKQRAREAAATLRAVDK